MIDCSFRQLIMRIGKSVSVLITLFFPFFAVAAPVSAKAGVSAPASVAFWYAERPPLSELSQFDWIVFEPAHLTAADVRFVVSQGSKPFAYLSVGELDEYQAQLDPDLRDEAASEERNDSWNSSVMDLTSDRWKNHLLERASDYADLGYSGLFLDTMDSFTLLPEDQREAQRKALLATLQEINQRHPQLKLFFNRGFEVLPDMQEGVAAVAVESIYAGWNARTKAYNPVPDEDRAWIVNQLQPLRERGIPIVAIDYLPADRRDEARELAKRLVEEDFVPYVGTPDLATLGLSSIEVQPRRIALLYDPREGELTRTGGFRSLGGLLEYMGYRIDYIPVDDSLQASQMRGLYAGVVIWMTSGAPLQSGKFNRWILSRMEEGMPLAFFQGLPVDDAAILNKMGLQRNGNQPVSGLKMVSHDPLLIGEFEAPLVVRSRGMIAIGTQSGSSSDNAALVLVDDKGREHTPVVTGDWGGMALAPYVFDGEDDTRRWIVDPFAFLQKALQLETFPAPDVTTENGRRIATVHIDGDGFPSRAEVPGTPYAGTVVLNDFIKPYPLLTSVSFIEGEVGPKGMYPYLARELEPLARRILAHGRVEPATHTYSHHYFWQAERESQREGFQADYGLMMPIPGYDKIDFPREVTGSRDYVQSRLAPDDKPVNMIFWSGDAIPDAATIELAYDAGMLNVNGGETRLTHADPSLTGLYPLLRPTSGGLQVFAPIINENVYTNLWQGPYYGFRDVIDTFELTETPRRMRGLHLYYHFYSGTKPAAIKVMGDIYRHMLDQDPISLWMSDYLQRAHGLHTASLARTPSGAWQISALQGLRTVRIDPGMGWPDMLASTGVAGVIDLPQGRYVHLSDNRAVLALQAERDTVPALEKANVPLTAWRYLDARRVELSFAGEFPIAFSVRSSSACRLDVGGRKVSGRSANGLWHFTLSTKQVSDAQLVCE
ncbi:bifunctional glycoside hydrolase 114/ polysaccharide deacetylase family protein [uncultured Halopseudomonas sp.]|uniref:bifunctional glycoside hydrolase 114/ polysaccharide deacetylase family protein n=1 Tax=uncultured Halopseudomonas sp. TaxID=2901193 RepID=UPI0030ECBC6A|tara:strand:- start:2202 stop:5036 length:2835 start_codon:yes stop_codon:yes gene_type:complete